MSSRAHLLTNGAGGTYHPVLKQRFANCARTIRTARPAPLLVRASRHADPTKTK